MPFDEKTFNEMSTVINSLKQEVESLKTKKPDDKKPDDKKIETKVDDSNLADKLKLEADHANETKEIESAVGFTLSAESFFKENKDLLPTDSDKLLELSKKEKYGSKIEQANDLKSSLIQKFFSIQDNLDLLTATQKATVEDYLKLTKDAKLKKANEVYLLAFEPTIEIKKRVLKAEEIAKSKISDYEKSKGIYSGSEIDKAYESKLNQGSEKFYFNNGGK